ncbi:MAG: T9SS type A sorting domain-containing protein [Saprospiraceae bacterium]|nr:T9SS type A sorting domain-containing protein [Saprospiraceae bacterium]
MRLLTLFLCFFISQIFVHAQFAPLGAEWKYTYHNFNKDYPYNCDYNICDQDFGNLTVIDTTQIDGLQVSVLSQGEDYEPIYIHSRNDSVFFYALNEFHLLYDFTAEEGDTIDISVPTFYTGPGSYNTEYFNVSDSVIDLQVTVSETFHSPILINGEERKIFDYESVDHQLNIMIPNIIEGIGSGQAFLGSNQAFVQEGCFGFFICYEDENQSYTPYGCCEYPEDFPEREFAPLGAEWWFEGWSMGTPNTSGCKDYCEGNYNLFKVEDEINISGRVHAVVNRYHRTKLTDWEPTGDVIYLYDYDGNFYAHQGFFQFNRTYTTEVAIGDTIFSSAVDSYPKWYGIDNYPVSTPTVGAHQVVENIETIIIDGQERKKITFKPLDSFAIGTVIEGIGPLFYGLLGSDIPIPASGCAPELICYKDNEITYVKDEECGCEFPQIIDSVVDVDPSEISIIPNPAQDLIFIDLPDNLSFQTIDITTISGQGILSQDFQKTIKVGDLPHGFYLLTLHGNENRLVKKFIKN